MDILIRPFSPASSSAIAALEAECFNDPWSQNAITEAAEYGTVFLLAECEGKTVGYAGVKPIIDEGYISNVAVTKAFRGKGVASLLMKAVDRWAAENGIKTVSLEVRPSNLAALGLYEKFGYKQVGSRRNFYSHPTEDGLILTKEIE